jgi:glutathione S-transferase
MKLLALPTSPYAARVLIQVYEKGIHLNVEHPGQDVNPRQHAALNPLGRTPILLVGDQIIIESAAIQEYLEDLYPDPSLRGADALETAKMRAFIRAVDLYLFPGIYALRAINKEDAALHAAVQALRQVIDDLQQLFCGNGYVCGNHLTLADCTLVPAGYYLERFFARYGQESVFVGRPVLQRWRDTVNRHESVRRVTEQLTAALALPV